MRALEETDQEEQRQVPDEEKAGRTDAEERPEERPEQKWHHVATLHHLEGLQRRVDIVYDSEAVRMAFDKAAELVGRHAMVKGFRRGKAPKAIVEHFCRDDIRKGASSLLSQEGYLHAVYENSLSPMSKPDVRDAVFHMDGTFSCSIFVEVRPDIDLSGYIGLRLKKPEVDPAAIADQLIADLREKHARMEDREVAEPRAIVEVDYRVSVGDDVITDMRDQSFLIMPDGNSPIGEGLVGMRVGDVRDDKMTLPDDIGVHGGKEADVRIELKKVRASVSLTDEELAQAAMAEDDTIASFEDLLVKARRHAEAEAGKRVRQSLETQVVDRLLESHEFEVPEAWVRDEIRYLMSQMNIQRADEQVQEAVREIAQKNVRRTFILDAIYDAEKHLAVSPEDIKHLIAAEASRLGLPEAALRRKIIKQDMMKSIAGAVKNAKIMDFLIAGAQIDEQEAGSQAEEILPPQQEEEAIIIVPPAD